ncbi:MAG: glycosyltransferase family 2 protein [Desulfovibrio sp.]|nr:glycosyltransferase family 2 protein [Desulfovibrio sp.]
MPNPFPPLSIGMPVYNGEKTIAHAIESVLDQEYQDFHLHIFNDCSTDNSFMIAKEYAAHDKRIFLYENQIRMGQPGNFNKCLHFPGYKYVSIKSQDDVMSRSYYKECIDFLEYNSDYVSCYTNDIHHSEYLYQYEEDDPYVRAVSVLSNFYAGNINYGVYRFDAVEQTLPWQYIPGNDHVYNFNISLFGKIKKISKSLYQRNWPKRSTDAYLMICTEGFKTSDTIVVSKYKYIEILLGFLKICHLGNLNSLNRDKLIDIIIDTMLKTRGKQLLKELVSYEKSLAEDKLPDVYSRQIQQQRFERAKFYLINQGIHRFSRRL